MHPYWKRDTEEALWKSNITSEDKVPVLFKNWVPKSKPWLCCPWQALALHQQLLSSAAFPPPPGKRCRSDARSPPGDSPGHRHRLPPPGTAPRLCRGTRNTPASGRKTDGFLWHGSFWAPICSRTVHISIFGSEVKVKVFLKVTQTVLNTEVRLIWNQEPSLVGCT